MSTSAEYYDRIQRVYEDLGFTAQGHEYSLCEVCSFAAGCWANHEHRKPTGKDVSWSYISLPWVGEDYATCKVAFIGINPYEGGGLDFFPKLVPQAVRELESGRRAVSFGIPRYRSLLWHRIGLYASSIVNRMISLNGEFGDLKPYQAYKTLAFVNHIKCSPTGDRSAPTNAMWNNCSYVLAKELEILRPNILCVIGRGDNFVYTLRNLVRSHIPLDEIGNVRLAKGEVNGKEVLIINVPHTAAYGGSALKINEDLQRILGDVTL